MNKKSKIVLSFVAILVLTFICATNVFAVTQEDFNYNMLSDKGQYANSPYANTYRITKYKGTEENVVIPSKIDGTNVTLILANGSPVFEDNQNVKTVTIPEGVLTLEGTIFKNCRNLTTVVIPSTVKEFKGNIAVDCPNLKLQLPEGLEKMYNGSYRSVQDITVKSTYDYDAAIECFNATNNYRSEQGKTRLKLSSKLTDVAMRRAAELAYHWDHTRPNGLVSNSIWWNVAKGENIYWSSSIAPGYSMFAWWRDSDLHRKQMLDESHTSVGIGCVTVNNQTFGVQIFSNAEELLSDNEEVKTGKKDSVDKVQISELYDTVSMQIKGLDKAIELLSGETISATEIKLYNIGPKIKRYGSYVTIELSDVIWKSSDENVFTVDKNGLVTAKNVGSATLTAKVGDKEEAFNITVKDVITAISLGEDFSIFKGDTKKINVSYSPSNTKQDKTVTWKSSNPEIATISPDGTVKAVNYGTTTITATSKTGLTSSIKVTVSKPNVLFTKNEIMLIIGQASSPLNSFAELGEKEIEWSIADTTIANIDNDGNIIPLKLGETTITATSADGTTTSCKVKVSNYLKGDMDKNDIVNGADASIALDKYNKDNATEEDLLIGDMDGNGIINGTDASMILDIYNKVL